MSDDLKTAKTALAKLHQNMEAMNKLAKPSYPRDQADGAHAGTEYRASMAILARVEIG